MRILCELVTVFKEQKPLYHWETGKMADVRIDKSGDLPAVVQERWFQPTSNWEYIKKDRKSCLLFHVPFFENGFSFCV